jgi:hypothetical protein
MEYKELLNMSNIIIAVLSKSMMNMGLSGELIISQVSDQFMTKEIQLLMADVDTNISGEDLEFLQSFGEKLLETGAVQKVDIEPIVEPGNRSFKIGIGDCCFMPATQAIRSGDSTIIPPCPWLSFLTAAATAKAGEPVNVIACNWKPELNTCEFTIQKEA